MGPHDRRLNWIHQNSFKGGKCGINIALDGSNTTLITNASSQNMKELKGASFSHLEPLRESFEEESSSEDDGLNMKRFARSENKRLLSTFLIVFLRQQNGTRSK